MTADPPLILPQIGAGVAQKPPRQRAWDALCWLYGDMPDFRDWFDTLWTDAERMGAAQSVTSGSAVEWLSRKDHIGYSAYIDRFCGDLNGLPSRIPHLKRLGVTYLHLLPFYYPQSGASDGGFAVADYRRLDPSVGTIDDLKAAITALNEADIRLCLDFVLNHTARDHPWAQAALAGDQTCRARYHIHTRQAEVEALNELLPEVFPVTAPGNFTYEKDVGGWVRTTFYPFQWDLNYQNPDVFRAMLEEMLFLADLGVGALRLDSAPYLWKQGGDHGRNAPETHALIAAFRAFADVAAPSLVLKAEAIEPSHDIVPYLTGQTHGAECHMAYHATLMASLWVVLATGEAELLADLINHMPELGGDSLWLTYLRCHDDIGLNVLERETCIPHHLPVQLRKAADFLAGLDGCSYARGVRFQTQSADDLHGICGTLSALIGLDAAREQEDAILLEASIRRYKLLHAAIFAFGGIPLLYMGDDIGQANATGDFDDTRWIHRGTFDWDAAAAIDNPGTVEARLLNILQQLRRARQSCNANGPDAQVSACADGGLLALMSKSKEQPHVILLNFSEESIPLDQGRAERFGLDTGTWLDLLSDDGLPSSISSLSVHWLVPRSIR